MSIVGVARRGIFDLRRGRGMKGHLQVRPISLFSGITESFIALHQISGLPWLALVPLTTFGLRTVFTLPLSIWQRKRVVKQQELRKVVQAIPPVVKLRLAAAAQQRSNSSSGDVADGVPRGPTLTPEQIQLLALKETRNRQKKLFAENNASLWKNALLPLVQIPLWVSISMGLRGLTESRLVDSNLKPLSSDSAASVAPVSDWDLSLPLDSLPMLAPLVLGLLALTNVEHNGRMMTTTTSAAMGIKIAPSPNSRASQSMQSILNVSRLGCIFFMGISSQAPLLLSAYWISSQLYSFLQNAFLNWLWPYQR
ncbi:LADA_0G05446g1_1 [Lachancea dasiensis]|uniref:LADA_0G05446g1_1 n=1 Tax=Lachancea dasiensis TaxID=1072105 RepID=A0A1G4JT58_9SACH|nr:LADA_0G05446g1_1 [Lachancea dasiensis]